MEESPWEVRLKSKGPETTHLQWWFYRWEQVQVLQVLVLSLLALPSEQFRGEIAGANA